MSKKFMAVFMIVAMLLTLIPMTAFAAAPTVTFTPLNDAANIAVDTNITLSFSSAVTKMDGNSITVADLPQLVTLKEDDAAGANVPFTATMNMAFDEITISPVGDLKKGQDYYVAVDYVRNADGALTGTKEATFKTVDNDEAQIISFEIAGGTTVINEAAKTITVAVPYGTNVTALQPTIGVSRNAGVLPLSDVAQDFTNPVPYTVTAEDGVTTENYTVTVNVAPPAPVVVPEDRFASTFSADKTEVTADGSSTIKFTVYGYNSQGIAVNNPQIYFAINRYGTDAVVAVDGTTLLDLGNGVYRLTSTNNDGKAEVRVRSGVVGNAKAAFGVSTASNPTDVNKNLYAYLMGNKDATQATAGLIGVQDIRFTAPSTDGIALNSISPNNSGNGQRDNAYEGNVKSNGVEYYELSFRVTGGTAPVSGEQVTFSVDETQAALNKTSETTDGGGMATVRVSSTKPGVVGVRAAAAGKSQTIYVNFGASGVYTMELVSGGNEVVARNEAYSFKVKLVDANGNRVVPNLTTSYVNGQRDWASIYNINVDATRRPSDVALAEKLNTSDLEVRKDADGNLQFRIKSGRLNKDGQYVIKAYLPNGRSVEVPFEVKKQGTITRMELSYPSSTLILGGTTGAPKIKYFDANDVMMEREGNNINNVTFAASPQYRVASWSNVTNGVFTASNHKDDVGVITVTAVDYDKNLSASSNIELGGAVSHFEVTAPTQRVQINNDAEVFIQFVDRDGRPMALGAGAANVRLHNSTRVISKPSDSIVNVAAEGSFASNLRETGKAKVNIKSNVAGNVAAQLVVEVDGTFYTGAANVTFGEPAPAVDKGAKSLVLQIGSTVGFQDGVAIDTAEFAPFIQNATTFVPVRVLANAFNAEAAWDQATQTATLTRADMKISMTVGSNAVIVEKDGVTATVEANEAMFVNENNRLCAPMRAIAEAFGAELDFGPKTGAVTWVSFTQN